MIGNLNHVAIAVSDVEAAAKTYRDILGVEISQAEDIHEHGVKVIMIKLPNTVIELMEPLNEKSPIAKFVEKNPVGGIHHICYEVEDIIKARDSLKEKGARVLGNGEPRIGAHGNPILFLHPKDFCGSLVELEEVKSKS